MLDVCFSPKYFAHTHTNSMEKLLAVGTALEQWQNIRIHEPECIDAEILSQVRSCLCGRFYDRAAH